MQSIASYPLGSAVATAAQYTGECSRQTEVAAGVQHRKLSPKKQADKSIPVYLRQWTHKQGQTHSLDVIPTQRLFFPNIILMEKKSYSWYECISCLCLASDKIPPLQWPCKDELVAFTAKHKMNFCYASCHIHVLTHLRDPLETERKTMELSSWSKKGKELILG